jgi:hypothetical protein
MVVLMDFVRSKILKQAQVHRYPVEPKAENIHLNIGASNDETSILLAQVVILSINAAQFASVTGL